MIQITVKLIGNVAEVAGEDALEYALVPPARLATVVELIGLKRPALAGMLGSCRVTVNGENADMTTLLCAGDEVAILEPA